MAAEQPVQVDTVECDPACSHRGKDREDRTHSWCFHLGQVGRSSWASTKSVYRRPRAHERSEEAKCALKDGRPPPPLPLTVFHVNHHAHAVIEQRIVDADRLHQSSGPANPLFP